MTDQRPERLPWGRFPDVVLHADVAAVKGHVDYSSGKAGDPEAAARVVRDTVSALELARIAAVAVPANALIVSVHAIEARGANAIPEALARVVADRSGLEVDRSIVQSNIVNHTGAGGFERMARQALFAGAVVAGRAYVLADDFIGQGGTLANLRGFIEARGGRVLLATSLTGKVHSAKLALDPDTLVRLRSRHGQGLEEWWRDEFGFSFECLTESEARYLERTPDADTIRDRVAAAEQARGLGAGARGAGQEEVT